MSPAKDVVYRQAKTGKQVIGFEMLWCGDDPRLEQLAIAGYLLRTRIDDPHQRRSGREIVGDLRVQFCGRVRRRPHFDGDVRGDGQCRGFVFELVVAISPDEGHVRRSYGVGVAVQDEPRVAGQYDTQ